MISCRSLFQSGATATALAGMVVAVVQCQPTEAPAAEYDPIFAAIDHHRADGALGTTAADLIGELERELSK